ncbi:hypothetical protein [Desulfitobacterium sp.]|uniref:Uncharacterized protein n=1 Tax=bioreactor metagenome TaxID=1076179 RepID=A0A645I2N6_9ZZZZ|nr:hypothetical protein [Desulfitobacterium sp.]MEA4902690.1 hypothetical protein [Desulfitobacterium sp.]
MITKETLVEEILQESDVITYFIQNRVSPFSCAGPFPQSLGKLLAIKNVNDPEAFIAGLNDFLAKRHLENL